MLNRTLPDDDALFARAMTRLIEGGPTDAHITGVASDDWLKLRMGPGSAYAIIGSFPARATGLTMTTCVPFMSEGHTHGRAAARFLMEAMGPAPQNQGGDALDPQGAPLRGHHPARHRHFAIVA